MKLKTHSERKQPPFHPHSDTQRGKNPTTSSWVISDRRQGSRKRRLYRANQVKLVSQESGETNVCAGQVWFRLTEVLFWSTQTGTRQQTSGFLLLLLPCISLTRLVFWLCSYPVTSSGASLWGLWGGGSRAGGAKCSAMSVWVFQPELRCTATDSAHSCCFSIFFIFVFSKKVNQHRLTVPGIYVIWIPVDLSVVILRRIWSSALFGSCLYQKNSFRFCRQTRKLK